jgi:hypothetical protein
MAGKEKVVVAKRGCTCCGTGCVLAGLIVPMSVFALWETAGLTAAVVAWPAAVSAAHAARLIRQRRSRSC